MELRKELKGHLTRSFCFTICGITNKWREVGAQGDDAIDQSTNNAHNNPHCLLESDEYASFCEMSILHHEAIGNQCYL